MKKMSLFLVITLIMMTFVSCGNNKNNSVNSSVSEVLKNDVVESESESGVKYNPTTITLSSYNKDNSSQYFNIDFPTDEGREIRYGRGSAALDGTRVICGRTIINETIECESIKDIYNTFVGRWEESAQSMRDSAYSDCKFVAEKSEMTEINGFSMCRYEGTHTYKFTDFDTGEVTPYSCYFVAYGTQLSEGGFVYWIVIDDSKDQSLKSLVNSNAENMAKSLEETTII